MNAKLRVAAIVLAIAVMAGLVLLVVQPGLNPALIRPLPLIAAAWVAFLIAAWLLRQVPLRASVLLIVVGGIAIQLAAVSAPPQNSNDLYRYIWDGRVQAAGIDPYEYVPAARQLAGLRNDFLWHPGAEYCVSQAVVREHPAADLAAGCTAINRPRVPTIYPPVAEAYFLGVHYLPGADESTTPIQATTAAVAVLVTVLLLAGLGRLGRDMRMAALWSWCPTVALEAGNSAHVDVVAVGIAAAALLVLATARSRRRTILGGVLLGLAIATKLIPALTVPAVLRRRWVTVCLAAGGTFVAVYIPHVIAVGSKVIGFLPGYLQQEGYTSGTRFGIIGLFAGGRAAIAAAVLVLALAALAVLRFADPDQPWRGAVVMTAAALAVATPHYQWYALLLVMLVALDGRPEWLAFAAGGYYAAEPGLGSLTLPYRYHDAIGYGVPVLVVAAGWLVRRELARRAARRTGALPAVAGSPAAAGAAIPPRPGGTEPVPADAGQLTGSGAFLPVGYPCGKHQTAQGPRAVNGDMSYNPSHRTPPRQDRWPNATPQEGWPAYSGRDDYRQTAGYRSAYAGYGGVAGGYEGGAAGGYEGGAAGGYWNGNGYSGEADGYAGAWDGDYAGADSYPGAAGYAGAPDDFAGTGSYPVQGEYLEPVPSGALLVAPDAPAGWRPRRSRGRDRGQPRGGLVVGALTGFLAAAVAIGTATLAAAFVRPQASPVIAVGGAFIDRTPSAVKNFAVEHFGENDKTMLLLGMYVAIAILAMVIGCLARRNAAIGVGGIAAFGLFGAFVAITRPESQPTDVIPSVVGGLAGIAAFAWLAWASAHAGPAAPVRHARAGGRRRTW